MTDAIYPANLFDKEIQLGFKLVDVENPKSHYAFQPKNVKAVVFELDNYSRIIKMSEPIGDKYIYCFQKFGVHKSLYNIDKNTPPKWNPTGIEHVIADTLISIVRRDISDGNTHNILTPDEINKMK